MVTIYTKRIIIILYKHSIRTSLADRFNINFSLTIIFACRVAMSLLLPPPPLVYHYQYYNQ